MTKTDNIKQFGRKRICIRIIIPQIQLILMKESCLKYERRQHGQFQTTLYLEEIVLCCLRERKDNVDNFGQ